MKRYYVVGFSDLSEEKRQEIEDDVREGVESDEDTKQKLLDVYGEVDMEDYIDGMVRWACDHSSVEWEIVL